MTWAAVVHLLLHAAVPAAVAYWGFPQQRLRAWLVMVATLIVDADHLLAQPIYAPGRCSIGFHPLHTYIPIAAYMVLALLPRTRLIGLGLVIHMGLDAIDCMRM